MSAHIVAANTLGKALQDEGLLPANCRLVEVSIETGGVACLRYEIFVSIADLPKIARALLAVANDYVVSETEQP